MSKPRIILGIDPGLGVLGYGLIRAERDAVVHIAHGCVVTEPGATVARRLQHLYASVRALRDAHSPTDVAVEQLFHSRNTTTALAVGQARGVAIIAAMNEATEYGEYSPTQVKHMVAGHGGARKRQIQEMVALLLGLPLPPRPDDAADALAVAICHARQASFADLLHEQGVLSLTP